MVRALKAFFPAVLLAYLLASALATQSNLGNLQMLGMDVGLGDRAGATFHDIIAMASSYLLLIAVAFVLGLPVAAGLNRLMPGQRALLYALAGFASIVALHLNSGVNSRDSLPNCCHIPAVGGEPARCLGRQAADSGAGNEIGKLSPERHYRDPFLS